MTCDIPHCGRPALLCPRDPTCVRCFKHMWQDPAVPEPPEEAPKAAPGPDLFAEVG